MLILGIESSCDETAAAVVKDGKTVLSDVIASQIDIHRRFGGVVPEIASRNHTLQIAGVVNEALTRANLKLADMDAIAVTCGAGLLGALLVGVSYAKALAYGAKKPLYAVSHIKGHIAANYLAHDITPPYICLLVSGGHSAILKIDDYENFKLLGTTRDDAAGEAFDKTARILGLPYPGGPEIERLAATGKPTITFSRPSVKDKDLDFSFSGLKTAVMNYVENARARNTSMNPADVAASFQKTAVDMLVENTFKAVRRTGLKTVAIAGGVSANAYLRAEAEKVAYEIGARLVYPPLRLCTDNAAMIAAAAYYMSISGVAPAALDLDASASIPL
ncbi:MAG: tRNA (adenosine(37)-N6)-threonylcarbamoyltransferase complex transferase subunit TsaD [Clostridiaceae bacterium]|jgi:N6-L-threonylcarbamoyladenine synthase|nr:tRNA (adenosine(37)-N6)-threonylcarbamoyltransferase complex transferase subunit TsaD [Clostridiaceae bacterium]